MDISKEMSHLSLQDNGKPEAKPRRTRADSKQRDRERRSSRSASPQRDRYRDRSRSASRDREYRSSRRERSQTNGHRNSGGEYDSYDRNRPSQPPRSFEDRQVAKEQMMSSIRETSQQDRRVYVGNLAYDVKWHHLKDYMRKGKCHNYLAI